MSLALTFPVSQIQNLAVQRFTHFGTCLGLELTEPNQWFEFKAVPLDMFVLVWLQYFLTMQRHWDLRSRHFCCSVNKKGDLHMSAELYRMESVAKSSLPTSEPDGKQIP